MKTAWIGLMLLCAVPISAFAQSKYVRDAMEKKYGAPGLAKLDEWMKNDVLNVKMKESYTFPYEMTMHVTTYKNGAKKDETDLKYFFNPKTQYFAAELADKKNKQSSLIIYDFTENAMLMLQPKEKTGLAFNINAFMSQDAANAINESEGSTVSCKKSGRTKSIRNYSCEEYVCTNEGKNARTEVWITNQIPVNILAPKTPSPLSNMFAGAKQLEGLIMEGNFYRDETLEGTIEVTSFNENAALTIVTSEYTFSNR